MPNFDVSTEIRRAILEALRNREWDGPEIHCGLYDYPEAIISGGWQVEEAVKSARTWQDLTVNWVRGGYPAHQAIINLDWDEINAQIDERVVNAAWNNAPVHDDEELGVGGLGRAWLGD